MKFKFLGTAAAEGIPALFCECAVCKEARAKGGRHIRTRSQAMIDDDFLIDFNPDTYMHFLRYGIDGSKIRHCIITHDHSDHFYPEDLEMRLPDYANLDSESTLTIYGSYVVGRSMGEQLFDDRDFGRLNFVTMKLHKTVEAGSCKVTPLTAIHGPHTGPFIYLIEKEGKTILYAHDTHFLDESVWKYLGENKVHLNLVSLDCTSANIPEMNYIGHMNLNDNVKIKNRLLEMGCADENTIFICNHFSHNGDDVSYDTFKELAAAHGLLTSYDGMEIEL